MSYQYNNSKILDQQDHPHNQTLNSQQIEMHTRALEEEIQLTVYNYQSLLQLQKKNSADRSEFLLFMIQSTRTRQQDELQTLKAQLQAAVSEKEEAMNLQKQMQSIGEGVDGIVEEGKKLKFRNQSLQRELWQHQRRQKQLDEEFFSCQKELQGYRQKIDEWQRTKIKWNRRKKELLQMISEAQQQLNLKRLETMNEEDDEHEEEPIRGLINKYKNVNRAK